MKLLDELRGIVEAYDREGVSYALCGGLAMAVYGRPRATYDIDLLVPPGEIPEALRLAAEAGFVITGGKMRFAQSGLVVHRCSKPYPDSEEILTIDLIEVGGFLEDVWASRRRQDWQFGTIPVVSPEGLARMKERRGSGQDRDDIAFLESLE